MAVQGQISITNTNLSGGSYNFNIYIRNCGSSDWGSIIETIAYSGFPYYFDVDQVLTGSPTCYEYLVVEPTSLSQCTGTVNFATPTPTPTKTLTPTPTPNPLVVYLSQEFSSGSTVVQYTLNASKTFF